MRLGKGVGVLAKGIGSPSPSFVREEQVTDKPQQFDVTAHKSGDNWYLAITPGWVQRVNCFTSITSTGNRNVTRSGTSGSNMIYNNAFMNVGAASNAFGKISQTEVTKVNCYKALRYSAVANDLNLGQQYLCDEEETLVVLYAPQPGSEVRLAVIGKNAYESTFCYSYFSTPNGAGLLGATPVVVICSELILQYTGGNVTGGNIECKAYWERVALMKRPLAKFNKTTGEMTVYNIGPQAFEIVSETYAVNPDQGSDMPPDIIDADWAAAYYQTGDSNGPSGYTFDY